MTTVVRERSKGGYQPLSGTNYWYHYDVSNQLIVDVNTPATVQDLVGSRAVMVDRITSRFRERSARGEVIVNPMSREETVFQTGDSGWRFNTFAGSPQREYVGDWSGNWCTMRYGTPGHLSLPTYDTLIAEVSTQARAGVLQPTVQGMVSLAEFTKTFRMLASPFKSLTSYIGRTGKRKGKQQSFAETARSSWLEYRYGWRPFMREIESIVEALGKSYSPRLTARAMRSQTDEASDSFVGSDSGVNIPFTIVTKRELVIRAGILYVHELALDGYQWGMSLRDLPSTAWELVPYSFVVDWFVNVSSFIEAVVPKAGVHTLGSWVVVKKTTTTTRTSGTATFSNWTTQRSPNAVERTVTKSTVRAALVPPPSLVFRVKSIRELLGGDARTVDAIALFTQSLR